MNSIEEKIYNDGVDWNSSFFDPIRINLEIKIGNYFYEPEIVEGRFTCPKCKCKKISVTTAQTRSGDEGQTVFLTCTNKECKKQWKFG